jgi:protein-tyrosine-phosphatase
MSAKILYVCTGNAARSVMAAVMTRHRAPELQVRSAGTFSISGQPMSVRTRNALAGHGLADPEHRSQQLEERDCRWADLLVVFEPQHVNYVRRNHAEHSQRTASLPRLLRDLPPPEVGPLDERISLLGLGEIDVEPWEEVVDPAGGNQDVFHACAEEISSMVDRLIGRLLA